MVITHILVVRMNVGIKVYLGLKKGAGGRSS